MAKLAINGGDKLRKEKFPPYLPIGKEELENVKTVFESSLFSRFLGSWHDDFYGGPHVQALEREWAKFFGVKHAIAVNSASSALMCAVGAIDIEPFDEIIVSPYTMCISATVPLAYNAIPVFADVEMEHLCLDPKSIEERITDRTKAIIVVDLFGEIYDHEAINAIAKKHNLKVIEDCSQSPYATSNGKYGGTFGDVGIFSLNYHKHIHAGEGGILVTNDDKIANKLRLIRNHAEQVIEAKSMYPEKANPYPGATFTDIPQGLETQDLVNMMGYNFRMTEIEAAISEIQLQKLPSLIKERRKNIAYLEEGLKDIPCLHLLQPRKGTNHVYYFQSFLFDEKVAGIHRDRFADALRAELTPLTLRETEGIKVVCGYLRPLYLLPLFQKKIAYGSKGFPWAASGREYDYSKGICPVAEDLHYNKLLTHEYHRPGMTKKDLDDVIAVFHKVWDNIDELK